MFRTRAAVPLAALAALSLLAACGGSDGTDAVRPRRRPDPRAS